ncbi:MAG: protease pro-enzyme activation domain-containing protein, partial [Actinomycetota bacterium]
MSLLQRPARAGAIAVLGLAVTALTSSLATTAASAAPVAHAGNTPAFAALANSLPHTTDKVTGAYTSRKMTVEVALAPRNRAGMTKALSSLYNRKSSNYHHWLAKGQFNARYAPTAAQRSAVSAYLHSAGLTVHSSSPFLIQASGSSQRVSAAFRTTLKTFKNHKGVKYFANSTAVKLPRSLASNVVGVVGLSNTVRMRNSIKLPQHIKHVPGTKRTPNAACQAPYPTNQQLFDAVNNGVGFPFGYGDAPGCNGLTPSQDDGIYGAPKASPRTTGAGVKIGVFELSEYQHSDIQTYAQQFFGPHYVAPLQDVNVDGGPLTPICPPNDQCPPEFNGFSGD